MMFWKNWNKRRKITTVICAAVLILLIILIYPRYRHFVDEDNKTTCYDARYWTGVRYQMAIRSALEDGAQEEDLDYEQLLRDAISANFSYSLGEDLVSDDLCRGGGVCTFTIDPDTHSLSIVCDRDGHEAYDDTEITDEYLDTVTW